MINPNMNKMNREVNWKDLPSDLLSLIVDKNTNAVDYIRLGAVCVSWRSVHAEKPNNIRRQAPALLLLPTRGCNLVYNLSEERLYRRLKLSLSHKTVCRGSDHGWLVIVFENREIQLLNPFLPLDTGIIQIPPLPCRDQITSGFSASYLRKAVLSANPSENPNFVVMAIQQDDDDWEGAILSFWRNGDAAWTPINNKYDIYIYIYDVVYYKDKFYALDEQEILVVDVSGPSTRVSRINASYPFLTYMDKKYLVESCGELLQIVRRSSRKEVRAQLYREFTEKFDVLKLDQIENKWIQVRSLGERMLFIGDQCTSFSLSTSNMPGCKPNNIYFVINERDLTRKRNNYFDDIGVFNLEDDSIKSLYPIYSKKMVTTLAPIFMQPTLPLKSSVKKGKIVTELSLESNASR